MIHSQEENAEFLEGFAWRLQSTAEARGLTQIAIAERLGVKRPRVGHWFTGRNLPRKAERLGLANLLGVSLDWLIYGRTERDTIEATNVEQARIEAGGIPVRQIPVISWTHAGEAATYEEMPKHFHGSVASMSTDPRAFAVTVEGDCMEPKVYPGDRVVCEPSNEPRNGRIVVAKYRNDEVALRIYTKLPSGSIRLASMKPDIYPTIEHSPSDFYWIYPVKELSRAL